MKVPFFDLNKFNHNYETEIADAILNTIKEGHYILGPQVNKFEEELKKVLIGSDNGYVISCNSATDALILSMLCCNIGIGDEVIVPSHTAIPTVAAIRATGATPKFADIDKETWLIDIDDTLNLITQRTKAIIAVHLYGNIVNIFEIKEQLENLNRTDIKIIEDCAQAQGSRIFFNQNWFEAGTIGDYGCYSFYPTKNIGAIGDGGAIFVKNEDENQKLRMLRNYGQKDRYNALIDKGINSRLDEIQAAVLITRLKYLKKWSIIKTELMQNYQKQLSARNFIFQKVTNNCEVNWHLSVIRLQDEKTRNLVQKHLFENGVATLIHYPMPTHKQKAFAQFSERPLPNTEKLSTEILSLPLNPALTDIEQKHIIKCLLELK